MSFKSDASAVPPPGRNAPHDTSPPEGKQLGFDHTDGWDKEEECSCRSIHRVVNETVVILPFPGRYTPPACLQILTAPPAPDRIARVYCSLRQPPHSWSRLTAAFDDHRVTDIHEVRIVSEVPVVACSAFI